MGQHLTPNSAAGDNVCRVFRIPQELNQHFTGAIETLAKHWNWEEFGTLTAVEVADLFREILDSEEHVTRMVGVIVAWSGRTKPSYLVRCQGQTLLRSGYSDLWDVWDDQEKTETDLTLPDMRERVIYGASNNQSVKDEGGVDFAILNIGDIPSHNHTIANGYGPGGIVGVEGLEVPTFDLLPTLTSTSFSGGGTGHENRPPYTQFHWCVVARP